jgi:hypothetical protein
VFEDIKEGADKLGKEGIEKLSGKDKKSAMQEEMAPLVGCFVARYGRFEDRVDRTGSRDYSEDGNDEGNEELGYTSTTLVSQFRR